MTQYVYVLIASQNNSYAAMCLISALSARDVDPNAQITVLSDTATSAMLIKNSHQLLEIVDEVVDCSVEGPPTHASRAIKTTMLPRLQNDFIYLDVDTILLQSISHKLTEDFNLQMVWTAVRRTHSRDSHPGSFLTIRN